MIPVSLDCALFLFFFSPSCLPYDVTFSGLCSVFVLFLSVLSTLCCPLLWIVLCFCFVFLRLMNPIYQSLWIVLCFCFVFLRLVYPMLLVSPDCAVFLFCFSPSCLPCVARYSGLCFVFVLFFSVLCTLFTSLSGLCCVFVLFLSVLSTLCYQFLWIVLRFCFVPLRLFYPMLSGSLDCVVFLLCSSPSCLPYVASFSGLCFVFVLFLSVLSTLC
jgi:hypothetical protein